MAKTINIRFLLILICIILSPCGTHSQVPENCRVELPAKDVLVQTARYVANTFGSAYVPYFNDVEISEAKIFQRDDYGDSYRKIRKQIGREYWLTRYSPWQALPKYQRNTIEEEWNIPNSTQLASESLKL